MSIIVIHEKYKAELVIARLTPSMEVHNPYAYEGFGLLYQEARKSYPKTPTGSMLKEVLLERARDR